VETLTSAEYQLERGGSLFANSVVEAFRDQPSPDLAEQFTAFAEADWAEGLAWLYAQDMECYFLRRITDLGMDQMIPLSVRLRMKKRYAENEARIDRMFDAFVQVNDCLQDAGITFCNVQGFALVPAMRADPRLRSLPALRLLVLDTDIQLCRESLSTLGYAGSEIGRHACGGDSDSTNHDRDSCKGSSAGQIQTRIDVVAATAEGEGRAAYRMLTRRRPQMWNGCIFEAPTASDNLVAQALDIESQLAKGGVLLADLLEVAQCIRFWSCADEFWEEVVERSLEHPNHPGAVGAALMAASRVFGVDIPTPLRQYATQTPNDLLLPLLKRFGCATMECSPSRPSATSVSTRRTIVYPKDEIRADEADDTQLLERICAAYVKTIEEASHYSREYGPSPWWESVERKNFSEVQTALRKRDIPALRGMYQNFFRTACGTGLARRPLEIGGSRDHFDPDEAELCVIREDTFYRIGYWRVQTAGRLPISALRSPNVGNPFGVIIEETLIAAGAEFQHACAHRIAQLTGAEAKVVEIGGGFGNMAYYLLKESSKIKYVDFDMPESLALTAYFLGKSSPNRLLLLYGEADFSSDPKPTYDIALMPPWMMGRLPDRSVDLTFSSHVLWDLIPSARERYLEDIARFTSGVLLDISNEKDQETGDYERLFTCAERRPSYWNLYRAPQAKEWEQVLRPLR